MKDFIKESLEILSKDENYQIGDIVLSPYIQEIEGGYEKRELTFLNRLDGWVLDSDSVLQTVIIK